MSTNAAPLTDEYLTTSVALDPLDIETECERAPTDLLEWGRNLADALHAQATAAAEEKFTEATLDAEVRQHLSLAGTKITEKAVESTILVDPRMRDATRSRNEAARRCDRAQAAVDAVKAKVLLLDVLSRAR